jgi:transcriptional regulator with XRE-family HTH domain
MRSSRPSASLFGYRLRAARLRAGIPQDRLGVMVGLDEGTASARISRYETGVHAPPFELATRLAKALNIPTAYFYCDDELAPVILAWGQLSGSAKERLIAFIDDEIRDAESVSSER